MTNNFLDKDEFSLAGIKPNKKGEVCTYNSLSYEGNEISITGRHQFKNVDTTRTTKRTGRQ